MANAASVSAEQLENLTARAVQGTGCSRDEAQMLAGLPLATLVPGAIRIRETFFGNKIQLCVILNARSGACSENCRYCAQSAHHKTTVESYPLQSADTMAENAAAQASSGAIHYGIVTSGPGVNAAELAIIGDVCGRIQRADRLHPCASLGTLSVEQLRELKRGGLTRYHHNLETSERFFPSICTTHTWAERVQTVRNAQAAGLEVCSGGLFGLGEGWDDRIDLALTLRELGVRSVPVNFLSAIPGTPLEHQPRLSADEALRILAVFRYLMPTATLRVCGGRPAVLGERQREMFGAGANAFMTGNYLTTAGQDPESDRRMVAEQGLTIQAMA